MSAATERTQHVVAAQPGFTVLEPIADASGEWVEFCRHPVVAWRVELTYAAHRLDHIAMTVPVTVDYCSEDGVVE